jgi:regulator of sigma E protease
MHGVPEPATILRDVLVQTPAHLAGLRGGDKVLTVNGQPVTGWSALRWTMLQAALQENRVVKLDVSRRVTGDQSPSERTVSLELSLSSLSAKDLEGDFLIRLGLEIARPPAVLGKAIDDGPAQRAGFQAGDRILTVDNKSVIDSQDLVELIRAAPNKTLSIGGKSANGEAFLRSVRTEEVKVNDRKLGQIKVEISSIPTMVSVKQDFGQALLNGTKRTWDVSALTLKLFGKMLIGEASWKNVTGPITIAEYAGQSARLGWESFVLFIALISISLGVMNLLPIPVLDGGFLLYYSLEVLLGRPLPERVVDIGQRIGLGLLIMLMSVAIVNDVMRQMP